jgi:hypothetical protein
MQFPHSPLSAGFVSRPSPQDIGSFGGKEPKILNIKKGYQIHKSLN